MASDLPQDDAAGTAHGYEPLFAQVNYWIVLSKDLDQTHARQYARMLNEHGAAEGRPPSKHCEGSLESVTHIISTTIDFEDYDVASNRLIPIIKPGWIQSSIMKRKLANPRSHSPDPRLYFSGLILSCADIPEGDKDAIIGGVISMGGLYASALSKTVTHIVALSIESEKCKFADARSLNCKIVLPHWFDDCLRLGRRIDEGPYLLPNPEIHRFRQGERIPDTERIDLQGAVSINARLPASLESPSLERKKLSVFKEKGIMLSDDLEIAVHLRKTIEDLICSGGGKIVNTVDAADIYICQYREGDDYKHASRAKKTVGNLPWLYYLFTHNSWTSPLQRLLHYPIARNGLPGFANFRISLSNYNGDARIYLENLAKAAGCEFTKTMKMDNTHLITAHTFSEKCDAAKEWNVNMINHLWLEESYAKWQIQSISNPRYTHFPPRTNLSEVVGQTPIDREAVARNFFPEESKGADAQSLKIFKPADQTDKAARVSNGRVVQASSPIVPKGGFHNSAAPTPQQKKKRHTMDDAALRTPMVRNGRADDKENETPSTTGSRGAKERAAAKIHDLAPDIALYEKEKKRVGGVIHGGRKVGDEARIPVGRKRAASTEDSSAQDESDGSRGPKRAKQSKTPRTMQLILSGYDRWINKQKEESDARRRLKDMGISLLQDSIKCTHLAAPRILRTPKFLAAIAHAPVLLSTTFVDECLKQGTLLAPEDYPLTDPEGENRLDINLTEVIARAKANKGRLLRGYRIYCTENVHGGFNAYESIVKVNGGSCSLYKARSGSIAPSKAGELNDAVEELELKEQDYIYLVTGLTQKDAKLWPRFRQTAQEVGRIPRIVKNDWILDLALTQEIRWKDEYEARDSDIKTDG